MKTLLEDLEATADFVELARAKMKPPHAVGEAMKARAARLRAHAVRLREEMEHADNWRRFALERINGGPVSR